MRDDDGEWVVGAVCKTVAKATVVRIHYPPQALRSARDQGKPRSGPILFGPVESGSVRLSTAIHGNMTGTLDHDSWLEVGIPSAVDPPLWERARRRRRHDTTTATNGNHAGGAGGGSARLARVDGGRASRSRSAPPEAAGLWGPRAWQRVA